MKSGERAWPWPLHWSAVPKSAEEEEEEEERCAREIDANLMRASLLRACGAPRAAHQSLARRKMYVHFKCGTQIFHFFSAVTFFYIHQ